MLVQKCVCTRFRRSLRWLRQRAAASRLEQVSSSEMNVTPGGSSSSSSSSVSFAAHTHRGGIGEWMKLRAAELSDASTQVAARCSLHAQASCVLHWVGVVWLTARAVADVCHQHWNGSWKHEAHPRMCVCALNSCRHRSATSVSHASVTSLHALQQGCRTSSSSFVRTFRLCLRVRTTTPTSRQAGPRHATPFPLDATKR